MDTRTPRGGPPVDRAAFEKLRRILPAARARDAGEAPRPLPEEIAFKLTNRCDLRCRHCYQWNDTGYHRRIVPIVRNGDLDLAIVERVLAATRAVRSNVYLWGGEPLAYRHWDGLVDLLAADPRWTSMCTNGTLLARRLASLCRISERFELVLALDGFEAEHDALRGEGSFAKARDGLRAVVVARRRGAYRGEITVNCVFQDAMVGRLHAFAAMLEDEGVDTLYLSYPWFLSPAASAAMDGYVARWLPWVGAACSGGVPSWHGYKFGIDPARFAALSEDLDRIDAGSWRIKIRYNPELDAAERERFLLGSDQPAQGRTRCESLRTRMDVFPNGDVVSCKFFPEFAVANLARDTVPDAWRAPRFDAVRDTVAREGLMPVCAKCNLLYTRGA
jgi:radical SAM protein with 4Fe4S-binding SPASM domain